MDRLCTQCGALFGVPVHQLWKMPDGTVWHYPAYFFVFGPADRLTTPDAEHVPDWDAFVGLAPPAAAAAMDASSRSRGHEATFESAFLPQSRLPTWIEAQPLPCEDFNLGACKQKAVALAWWLAGVHQLVLWSGSSRPGVAARARHSFNRKGKKGKGKK